MTNMIGYSNSWLRGKGFLSIPLEMPTAYNSVFPKSEIIWT